MKYYFALIEVDDKKVPEAQGTAMKKAMLDLKAATCTFGRTEYYETDAGSFNAFKNRIHEVKKPWASNLSLSVRK